MIDKSKRTVDYYHKRIISKFSKERRGAAGIKREIARLEELLAKSDPAEAVRLRKSIKLLRNRYAQVTSRKQEFDYYLKNMDLLMMYYDKSLFNKMEPFFVTSSAPNNNLNSFVNMKKKLNKLDLYNEYLFRTKIMFTKSIKKHNVGRCMRCSTNKILNTIESTYICPSCGECTVASAFIEKIPYNKDIIIEMNCFSYNRYDHFVDWLNRFQNSENVMIPKNVYERIQKEMLGVEDVTVAKIKHILKTTQHSKYHDYAVHIYNKITANSSTPKLSQAVEDKMKKMFKDIQEPFALICPNTRTNFLSYSYVIRKLLEILGQDSYVEYFPLLKSREKLYHQDQMWKKICDRLGWKFKPSL